MNNVKNILSECLKKQNINFYQTFTINDEPLNKGIRKNERRNYISLDDICGKNILDLGCATGAECLWAVEKGATSAIGIDKGDEQINTFNNIINALNFEKSLFKNKIKAFKFDLNNKINTLPYISNIDTVFCFAINQYISYRKLWHEVPSANVIYVEGGADSGFTADNLTDKLYHASFLGMTPSNASDQSNLRPLFKLNKK